MKKRVVVVILTACSVARAEDESVRINTDGTPGLVVPFKHGQQPERRIQTAPEGADYVTRRYELAGFPLLGGDSDIGFQFGGVATLTRFEGGVRPYQWNMDLLLAASVKSGPTGPEIAQQSYLWHWDVPALT